jgi:hypothetical protein
MGAEKGQPIKAELKAAERKATISDLIPKLAASCSTDMGKDQIFGRVIERLSKWGANDDEIGEYMKEIRVACEKLAADRLAEHQRKAAILAARKGIQIEDALKA